MNLFLLTLLAFAVIVILGLKLMLNENVVTFLPTSVPTRALMPTPKPFSADKLFQLVNEWRIKEDYQPYKKSEFACNIADIRLSEVKINWSHDGFHADRFCNSECTLGENLIRGYVYNEQEPEALKGWLNSSSHRANLEDNYTHSCIKCYSGICVHIFSYF